MHADGGTAAENDLESGAEAEQQASSKTTEKALSHTLVVRYALSLRSAGTFGGEGQHQQGD